MSELESLKAVIDAAAANVVKLKGEGAEPSAIKGAVGELLAAKAAYAEKNGGIGVDGKPFDASGGKKDKKKKGEAPPPKKEANADNAAKKAAKKAEAKAKKDAAKAAAKAGGGKPAAKDGAAPPAAKPNANANANKPPPANARPAKKKGKTAQFGKVEPLQLCFSPNDGAALPFVTLMCAVLTGLDPDLKLKMDINRAAAPALGTHGVGTTADKVISGDITCAKYFLNTHQRMDLAQPLTGGPDCMGQAEVDQWIEYSLRCKGASDATSFGQGWGELVQSVEDALAKGTVYLIGSSITIADIAVFDALGGGVKVHPCAVDVASLGPEVGRWFKLIENNPATVKTRHLLTGINGSTEFPSDGVLDPLVSGCHMLEGALPFEVTTRFPPEPSGYLHIGHAKAVLLNDYYARRYKGKLIVRFDDTNPSKEKEEFQQAIVEDLGKLGVYPDVVTYTSDYFEQMKAYAMEMIEKNLAFMDDTPQEKMQKERMDRQNSSRRGFTVQENMDYFDLMCSGDAEGAKWCLRAKINMQSVNGTMRDPVLYRQNLTPHHRSGTTYKAYPTYDLACPIVDSVEGVTHALRTTEYNDRDEQYAWIQNALLLRRVRIHGFARMNFMYTELSKRKLTWFADNGHVTGWDDPRFPTVRGVVRRGINIEALRGYILGQGASRRITLMEWSKFWAENKKAIDDGAKRFMAVSMDGKKKIKLSNVDPPSANNFLTTDNHPKFAEVGKRLMKISSDLMVESSDVEGIQVGDLVGLMRWGVMKVTGVGDVIEGDFVPDGDVKECKRKITWLSESDQNITVKLFEFDNLINKEKLEEGEDFKDFINESNLASMTVVGDAGMKNLGVDEVIQIERRGLYRVDKVHGAKGGAKDILGRGSEELVLFMIPDGKKKAMSSLSTKLDHR